MDSAALQAIIERAFEDRASITPGTTGEVRDAVDGGAVAQLDNGASCGVADEGAEGATGRDSWTVRTNG